MTGQTVAQVIARELKDRGVDRVFGLPGGEVLHLIEALRQQDITFHLFRHEASAGLAAAVYGKLKGVPGVVLTTLGPGAANLMLPIANSLLDCEPLLAISAQIPESWPSTHTHQRLPLLEAYGPVTKYAAEINAYNVVHVVQQALTTSLRKPAGPTYLTVSTETAIQPAYESIFENSRRTSDWKLNTNPAEAAGELAERLAEARNPLVLVGMGVQPEIAMELRQWIDSWGLPVAVTPKIKGIIDESAGNFVGVVGGMAIDNVMLEAIHKADLLIGFGFDPVEIDKQWHANCPIVWVLDAPLTLGVVPQSNLVTADFVDLLFELNQLSPPRNWGDQFANIKQERRALYNDAANSSLLSEKPVAIVRTLAEILPVETIVTTDVGSHKYIFGQFWPSCQPATFFMSNGLSGMGYGLAAAIGAKLARPDVPVLAALGDGGFSMSSQELETLKRINAPVITVVLCDESLSLIQISQQRKKLPRYGVDFHSIDNVKAAESCGIRGVRVNTSAELARVAKEAAESNQSVVIEVPVNAAAYDGIV